MTTSDVAFKTIFLDLLREQINTKTSAIYNKIKTSNRNIEGGNKVVKLAPFGLNGGFGGAGANQSLPVSGGNNYAQFKSWLKQMFGVIEIDDIAAEASKYDAGAFVNLVKANMEGLTNHAQHSFGRQAYLDGTGKLTLTGVTADSTTVVVASVQYLKEGMTIDILDSTGAAVANGTQRRIKSIPSATTIVLDGTAKVTTAADGFITEQGLYNKELTGLEAIMSSTGTLYELAKADYSWLIPQLFTAVGEISDRKIINAMLQVKNKTGGKTDFIAAAPDAYLEYYDYLELTKRNVNTMELKGGFSAISVNGVAMVDDMNVKSAKMELLDTTQFTFHQLADWDWMTDQAGVILKQVPGYAKWTATLRKYAEMICDHPGAQAELSGITIS
jgi:hypothetical protein